MITVTGVPAVLCVVPAGVVVRLRSRLLCPVRVHFGSFFMPAVLQSVRRIRPRGVDVGVCVIVHRAVLSSIEFDIHSSHELVGSGSAVYSASRATMICAWTSAAALVTVNVPAAADNATVSIPITALTSLRTDGSQWPYINTGVTDSA